MALVNALQIAPRLSWADAADVLGVHATSLAARWARLRKQGVAWITGHLIGDPHDMFDPVVISVGVLQAGTKRNVIPEGARFEATIRTFSAEAQAKMQVAIPRLLKGIAAAHGVEVDIDYQREYPLSITNADETEFAEGVIADLFGEERLTRFATPLSGSEDFSRVMNEVPGTFIGLSAVAPGQDHATTAFNHSPTQRSTTAPSVRTPSSNVA